MNGAAQAAGGMASLVLALSGIAQAQPPASDATPAAASAPRHSAPVHSAPTHPPGAARLEAETAAAPASALKQRLRVIGFGRVAYLPDLFELAFDVSTPAADARSARERHLPAVAAAQAAVRAAGAALADASQDAPRLRRLEASGGPAGYRFDTRMVVRVRGAEAVAALQQRLAESGIEPFERILPLSERLPDYTAQAQRQAVQDARRRAQTLAGELGWRLGAAIAVKVLDERPWWAPQAPTARQYGARAYNYAADAPEQGGEVTAQVEVEFAYRP